MAEKNVVNMPFNRKPKKKLTLHWPEIIRQPGSDSFRNGLMFCCCLFFFLARSLSSVGRSPRNFARCSKCVQFYNSGPNFWRASQKNFGGKKSKIWPDLGRLQNSAANISETDEDIQNRTSTFCTAIPPAFGTKKFGELWSTYHGD